MLYALICTDKPGSAEKRLITRPDHLAYLKSLGTKVKAAGPFNDGSGTPNGSLVIIDAFDREEAAQIATSDPYAIAGLFQSVDIRPWSWVINNPEG